MNENMKTTPKNDIDENNLLEILIIFCMQFCAVIVSSGNIHRVEINNVRNIFH